MDKHIQLSPAQIEFVKRTFPAFDVTNQYGELAGRAGSQRYFTRIRYNDTPVILVEWDSRDEDWDRFLKLGYDRVATAHLLPEIYAADAPHGLILEEDLGDITLKKYCSMVSFTREYIVEAYHQVLDALCLWQQPSVATHPVVAARAMDVETFEWESGYFGRFCVTDFCGCEGLLNDEWERERKRLARECASLPATAIHRDFQSENVLLHNGRVRFVDFQGARRGPAEYDVASLIFDPYILAIDERIADELYAYYCSLPGNENSLERSLLVCSAQRLMQALGAYGNLSLHKGKEWYREYVPVALERLGIVLRRAGDFPQLQKVTDACMRVVAGASPSASKEGPVADSPRRMA